MAVTTGVKGTTLGLLGIFASILLLAASGPASAQGIQVIGKYGDWSAHKFTEDGNPVCYMSSKPTKAEGDYTRRGDIYAIVTHRPAEDSRDVVSIVAGYTYETDSSVEITIGDQSFTLFTHDDGAWAPDEQTDQALVQAMVKGITMVVKGTSSRGTLTTDTYSLNGFTRAHDAISKACGL